MDTHKDLCQCYVKKQVHTKKWSITHNCTWPELKRHTFRKSCKCLSTPILTSSKSFKKPLKTGTKSPAVSWSPRITASSCIENASVRRTFHCKINKQILLMYHLKCSILTWGSVSKLDSQSATVLTNTFNSISCKNWKWNWKFKREREKEREDNW